MRLLHILRTRTADSRGDTIVEVLISLAILALVLGTAYAVSGTSLRSGTAAGQRSQALGYAQSQIEFIKKAQATNSYIDLYLYTSGNEFCVTTDGSYLAIPVNAAPNHPCLSYDSNFFTVRVQFSDSLKVFTINVSWAGANLSAEQSQLTLYYKLPSNFSLPTPPSGEICGNGIDDNGNGLIDEGCGGGGGGGGCPNPSSGGNGTSSPPNPCVRSVVAGRPSGGGPGNMYFNIWASHCYSSLSVSYPGSSTSLAWNRTPDDNSQVTAYNVSNASGSGGTVTVTCAGNGVSVGSTTVSAYGGGGGPPPPPPPSDTWETKTVCGDPFGNELLHEGGCTADERRFGYITTLACFRNGSFYKWGGC